MMIAKLLHRARKLLARTITPSPQLGTRLTHSAYAETQIGEDGSWVVRFYSYEPIGWEYQGETYMGRELSDIANVAEPTLRHPTTYAEGLAPAENIEAWTKYYAERPKAVTFIEANIGKANDRLAAVTQAYKAMRKRLDHYRREQP